MKDYVFAYGSLVNLQELTKYLGKKPEVDFSYLYTELLGYKRLWNVAMDNSKDISGYKYYIDLNNERPKIFVTFLNVEYELGSKVNGILFEVDSNDLAILDRREKNYTRLDVTENIKDKISELGRVWTYIGTSSSKERFSYGLQEGKAVIHEEYLEKVLNFYKEVSYFYMIDFIKTTDFSKQLQIISLKRIEIKR